MKLVIIICAVIGFLTVLYTLIGITIDITTFDQTKGGYIYPYEGWKGTPVNWASMYKTKTGLVKQGYVIDVYINGTTGMISFGVMGLKANWRTFSKRALKVHKPREGLRAMGFDPKF